MKIKKIELKLLKEFIRGLRKDGCYNPLISNFPLTILEPLLYKLKKYKKLNRSKNVK